MKKTNYANVTKAASAYWSKEAKKGDGFLNITPLDVGGVTCYLVVNSYHAFTLNKYEYEDFLQKSILHAPPEGDEVLSFGNERDQLSLLRIWADGVDNGREKEVQRVGLILPLTGKKVAECEIFYCPDNNCITLVDRLFTSMVNWENVEKITSAGTSVSSLILHFKNGQKALLLPIRHPENNRILPAITEALKAVYAN